MVFSIIVVAAKLLELQHVGDVVTDAFDAIATEKDNVMMMHCQRRLLVLNYALCSLGCLLSNHLRICLFFVRSINDAFRRLVNRYDIFIVYIVSRAIGFANTLCGFGSAACGRIRLRNAAIGFANTPHLWNMASPSVLLVAECGQGMMSAAYAIAAPASCRRGPA